MFLAAAGAMVLLAGCSVDLDLGDSARRVEHDTVPGDGIEQLVVNTDNGLVEVRGGDVGDIEVESIFDESDVGDGSKEISRDGNRLLVTGRCDREWHEECSVNFRIVVPSEVDVSAITDNGRVRLDDLAGAIEVETDNGRIEGDAIAAGRVIARTDNGAVELAFSAPPGDVRVRTDNGRIDLSVPTSEAGYAIDAETDNGDVDVDVPTDPSSPRVIEAHTSNGGISIATV
jgi:hypothetical protein